MTLDFTALNAIGGAQAPTAPQNCTQTADNNQGNKTTLPSTEPQKPPQDFAIDTGINILQKQTNEAAAERSRTAAIYKEYQDNIRHAGELRAELIKGAQAGEDIYILFLKAIKAISLMTSDALFYTDIEKSIKYIYGEGFREPQALGELLRDIEGRREKLQRAVEQEEEPEARARLTAALKKMQAQSDRLKQCQENNADTPTELHHNPF